MKHLLLSVLIPSFMAAGLIASPALAQDKMKLKEVKATNTIKVLHEDDRVRVTETTTKPGEIGPMIVRGKRVTRWLQGGTVERTYNDGRKEKIERKTGEVIVAGPDKEAYSVKNIGQTTIVSYGVGIKEPKK